MKSYPSILHWKKGTLGDRVIAFNKLDGSNIRYEWSPKRGWYKFGSRTELIDETHPILGFAIPLFFDKYAIALDRIFRQQRYQSAVVFCEYFGPKSFAGTHVANDGKQVVLFDVSPYKRGILPPKEFLHIFGNLDIPDVVYEGPYNKSFIENVQLNKWSLNEGVVCKNPKWMAKIKTNEYLTKLKTFNPKLYLEEVHG